MDSGATDFDVDGDFEPVERIEGRADSGVALLCDHARNAFPPSHGTLGLPASELERHIAYDIGARWITERMATRLQAPAVFSTFSRLLIDPNRGEDDPTLVMRYSDGAIVPGNAQVSAAEVERRTARYWRPYRKAALAMVEEMIGAGHPPAVVSIHSFTPVWRGFVRPWKVGALYDNDARLAKALLNAFAKLGLPPVEIGDNEPYSGGLPGDTIDAVATPFGLPNVLIEVRQDLIDTPETARAWGDLLAEALAEVRGGALSD